MTGSISVTLIATGAQAAAAVINAPTSSLETEINKHLVGTNYRHTLSEHDSPLLDEVINPVALSSGSTDMYTRALQWQTVISKVIGGTGNVWTRAAALPVGADNNSLFTIVNARTALATISSLMARDANARTALGGVDITISQTAGTGVAVTGIAAQTGYYEYLRTAALAPIRSVDSNGNQANAGTITAPTFIGALSGNATTATTATTANGVSAGAIGSAAIAAGAVTYPALGIGSVTGGIDANSRVAQFTLTRYNVAEGAVYAQTTPNMTVVVSAYYYYNSTNTFGSPPGTSPTYPTLPGAGLLRYDLLYTDDSFNLGWLVGTAAASSPAKPTLPAGSASRPLAWIGPVASGTTSITNAMVSDARPSLTSGGGTGSGGGGGGGAPIASPYVTVGSDPSLTNEVDIFGLAAGSDSGTVNGHDLTKFWVNLLRAYSEDPATVTNAPSVASLLINTAGGMELHPRNYIQFSGNSVLFNPCTIMFPNGKAKINLTQKTHTVAPPGGYSSWYIIADCTSTTDGTFDVQVLSAMPSLTPTQRLLAIALNNGTAFVGDPYVGWEPMLDVTSTQMRPITESEAVNANQSITTVSTPVEVTSATKVLRYPRNMKLQVTGYIRLICAAGSTAYGQVQATIDGIPLGMPSTFGFAITGGFDMTVPIGGCYGDSTDGLSLGPGAHTLRVMVTLFNAGNVVNADFVTWNSTQWGV